MKPWSKRTVITMTGVLAMLACLILLKSCTSSSGSAPEQPLQVLPVITLKAVDATTHREFSASLEGSQDIEIRAQVDGYLERIYVDEGAYVRKGQVLFQINDRPYREQLNNARAALAVAKANLANAEINVAKLSPLVQNNVVSDVQLKAAQASYDAAAAGVTQAEAMVGTASINMGYTAIKAPVDGYIGRIPFKIGSLVGVATPEALTRLSEVKEIYAYFSFSEREFLAFTSEMPGNTLTDKIRQLPPVELILADNSVYPEKGKVEIASGQFNNTTGAISFRATFPNPKGLLRSGNTGKIRIPRAVHNAFVIPQEATFELQDKVFVFALSDSNKVVGTPIVVADRTTHYYFVEKGIKPGDKIVYSGLDRLRDGVVIDPQPVSLDSLLKLKPF